MALYLKGFGEDGSPATVPAEGAVSPVGAALGLGPFILVAILFWAALAPPPEPRTKYRGRKH